MRKIVILLTAVVSGILFTGCSENLSDNELEVINENLPAILYANNIERRIEKVREYLWDAVDNYVDHKHDETQKEIDDYNSTTALFGGSFFDVNELFGSSASEQYAKRYYRLVDYANDHREDFSDDIEAISNIIINNPKVIDRFFNGSSTISLEDFSSIDGLPSSITSDQFESYRNLKLDKGNRAKWGELVIGTLKTPHYTPLSVLCAIIVRVERLKYPQPVYAVYQEGEDFYDEDGWEIGYDTEQAFFVTFDEDDDILKFYYERTDYTEEYIKSKKNKLTN